MDKSDIATLRPGLKDRIAEDRTAIRAGLMDAVLAVGKADRERLCWIAKADRAELWRTDGHRSGAQFVSATFQVSNWKARRWIEAAYALEHLPLTAAALESGALSLDKVVELARFSTPADETRWVKWASRSTTAQVRQRADAEVKRGQDEAEQQEATRYLTHSRWDDHIWFEGRLPVEEGEKVARAIDDLAATLPGHPDHPEDATIDQRRADAFVALVTHSGMGSAGGSTDTTVVVHAPIDSLVGDGGSATLGRSTLHPETARRLTCDSKIRTVVEDGHGGRLGIGDASRVVPKWLREEVLVRDGHSCSFPGCEHGRFLDVHHVKHWLFGGTTDIDNLLTLCHFHHKLIHEHRWSVALDERQRATWFRPGGRVYEPGPAPPITGAPKLVSPKKNPHRLAEAIGYSRLLGLAAVL